MTTPSPPSAASAAFAPADAWPAALTLSPFLVRLLAARPEIGDWLRTHADRPVDRAVMHAFLAAEAPQDEDGEKRALRRLRQRVIAALIVRDVALGATLAEVVETMTTLADVTTNHALDFWHRQLAAQRLNLLFSLCMGLPVFLLRHQIGGWFNDNVEVQAYVATLIILLMIYQFGDGLQYTFANALRGIACVKPMVLYAFIAYFVISLPLGYTLGFPCGLGILGIWIAFPFGLTIAGEMYRRRFEKELKKIEKE